MFIQNKYTKWYFRIVNFALCRILDKNIYVERHHIIPKSLGGSNSLTNLVKLTAREHFVCHRLLPKMTDGINKKKMIYAQNMMLQKSRTQQRDYKITSSTYEQIKIQFSSVNPFKDPEFIKESIARHTGSKKSDVTKQKLKDAWTDERKLLSKITPRRKRTTVSPLKGVKKPQWSKENNGFYGKKHSPETIEKFKQDRKHYKPSWLNQKILCTHCNREFGPGNYKQHHGDRCKFKA